MSNSKNLTLSSDTPSPIPPDLRNDINAALISGGGLRAIEGTLEHELQASGWIADLKAYVTHLLRSGECTTVKEVEAKVYEKIKQAAGSEGGNARRNNAADEESGSENENESANGHSITNGNGVHGNGNGMNGHGIDDLNLRIPNKAVVEGVQTIRKELHKIAEITVDEDVEAGDAGPNDQSASEFVNAVEALITANALTMTETSARQMWGTRLTNRTNRTKTEQPGPKKPSRPPPPSTLNKLELRLQQR